MSGIKKQKSKSIGSDFDDFLAEEGMLEEVTTTAYKRVIAMQIIDFMKEQKVTKVTLAKRMHTSRVSVDRLLDHNNESVTIKTLGKVARALGRELKVELV